MRFRPRDHGQGIDEQADLLLDALQLRRTARHRSPECHAVVTGVALQQQQPGGLHERVEGDFLLTGKAVQLFGHRSVQAPFEFALPTLAGGGALERTAEPGRLVKGGELRAPEGLADPFVLALQPADIVAVAPIEAVYRLACVVLQHLAEQLRITPAVEQDVMAGIDQLITIIPRAGQRQAQQWRLGQVEALLAFGIGQARQCSVEVFMAT